MSGRRPHVLSRIREISDTQRNLVRDRTISRGTGIHVYTAPATNGVISLSRIPHWFSSFRVPREPDSTARGHLRTNSWLPSRGCVLVTEYIHLVDFIRQGSKEEVETRETRGTDSSDTRVIRKCGLNFNESSSPLYLKLRADPLSQIRERIKFLCKHGSFVSFSFYLSFFPALSLSFLFFLPSQSTSTSFLRVTRFTPSSVASFSITRDCKLAEKKVRSFRELSRYASTRNEISTRYFYAPWQLDERGHYSSRVAQVD